MADPRGAGSICSQIEGEVNSDAEDAECFSEISQLCAYDGA
jgi:hypothetical protein